LAGLTLIVLFGEMLNPIFVFVANLDHLVMGKKQSECDFHKGFFFGGKMGPKLPDFEGGKKTEFAIITQFLLARCQNITGLLKFSICPSQIWLQNK
jgi:hypothetical protein